MALIEVDRLSRRYVMGEEALMALNEVSLSIDKGEFVAIVGASGSGKSTLMNLLGCLDRPSAGRYRLAGREVSGQSAESLARIRNREIGFVFQNFNLLARTSALENVELPLIYAGMSSSKRRERARAALQRVGLGERLDHHPSQLSGGQQQRVAIARALVTQPQIVLADEPTGALDSATGQDVMRLMQDLNGEGITIVVVTHEAEVAAFAGRVVTMRDGRILSDETREPAHA